MNILVTGGYGFIGSNFINLLLNKIEVNKIINVDCITYAANINNIPISKVESYNLNITNTGAIYKLLINNDITHVVHFAAESHVDNSILSPNEFITTNINGTFSLLEACRKYDNLKRFHHISTDEVCGSLGKEGFFTETTPYSPRSPYSASKAASDHLVNSYHHTYKLPITISNCSNNYGPNQNEEKLIPKIIKNIHTGKKVPIYGNGKNVRDWLYVTDHCDAIWDILIKGSTGETYNIGGNCEKNNIEILESICKEMDVDIENVLEFVEDRKGHDFRYAIDFTKINSLLDWSPKVSFEEGIKQTIKYYIK